MIKRIVATLIPYKWWFLGGFYIAVALGVWQVLDWREKAHRTEAAESARDAAIEQCAKDKLVTKETNDALQKSRDDIARRLADLKRMRPAQCVPIASATHPTDGGWQYAGSNGVDSDTLRDYAAQCESYRAELLGTWEFMDRVWATTPNPQ